MSASDERREVEPHPWDQSASDRALEDTWRLFERRSVKILGFLVVTVGLTALGALVGVWEAAIAAIVVAIFFLGALTANLFRAPVLQRDEARADRLKLIDKIDALEGRVEPIPEGFVSIRDALPRLHELRTQKQVGLGLAIELACGALVDRATEGEIAIWGRRRNSTKFQPIEQSYWRAMAIDTEDLNDVDGSPGRTRAAMHTGSYRPYFDLCVNYGVLDYVWPELRRKSVKP